MFKVSHLKASSNASRTIRFTEELFNTLNEIADQEGTSFNALVLQCCQYAIDNYDKNSEVAEKIE